MNLITRNLVLTDRRFNSILGEEVTIVAGRWRDRII
jgi:hypothetical protein